MAVSINHKIETLGKVIIAAMNGLALGGGLELAEACMLRVVVRHAMLGHPEVRIGAFAGFGGTTRLPRLIGKGRAAELLLTGSLVTAEEALKIGLVNRVVEPENLISETESLVHEIISQSPIAVRMTWRSHSSWYESDFGRISTSWCRLFWIGSSYGRFPSWNQVLFGEDQSSL